MRISDWSSDVCSSDLTKRLLLIAHLDTVFEPDSPFQRFERMGDKAKGPGVGDDKGGMVVAIAALRAMAEQGELTADKLLRALTDTKFTASIDAEFKQMPEIGRASCRERVCQYV